MGEPYRYPVPDLKTERLINLTMALLASKRLITKAEIFQSVAGYSGATESMERMFERDKDDLRSLGIEIEVAPLDSLFEDELGYRISPDKYSLTVPDLTSQELGVLSVAANSWQNSLFSQGAQRALRKLESLGVETSAASLQTAIIPVDRNVSDLHLLWQALTELRVLTFTYSSLETSEREVNPFKLSLFRGDWYLIGEDRAKSVIRTFKVRRMTNVSIKGKSRAFERPTDEALKTNLLGNVDDEHIRVVLRVRKGACLSLRTGSDVTDFDEDWDRVVKDYQYEKEALSEILWHGDDVVVVEPISLRSHIVALIESRIA